MEHRKANIHKYTVSLDAKAILFAPFILPLIDDLDTGPKVWNVLIAFGRVALSMRCAVISCRALYLVYVCVAVAYTHTLYTRMNMSFGFILIGEPGDTYRSRIARLTITIYRL